jgi:hypothetical protein
MNDIQHEEDKWYNQPKDHNLIREYGKQGKTLMDAMAELQWQYTCTMNRLYGLIYQQANRLALPQHYEDETVNDR